MKPWDFADIVRASMDAAIYRSDWDRVCDVVTDRCGLTAFFVYQYDFEDGRTPLMHASEIIRRNGAQLMAEVGVSGPPKAEEERYHGLLNAPPFQAQFEHELLGLESEAEIPRNDYRGLILGLSGATRRFGGRLNEIGPFLDVASGHTQQDLVAFGATERDEISAIFSIVGKSLEAGRMFRQLAHGYENLLDLFDKLDFGAAFCDRSGRVVMSNRFFRELASERDGITDLGGIVGATSPADRDRLSGIIASAARPRARPSDLIISLQRRSQCLPLIARTVAVQERQTGVDAPLVMLLVIDPESRDGISSDGLAAFGILSPEEIEICQLLVQGTETLEIAERRSTGVDATLQQIDDLNAKLACRHRLDLVRLAMMTSLPLRHEAT